jgi:hypothetical protein
MFINSLAWVALRHSLLHFFQLQHHHLGLEAVERREDLDDVEVVVHHLLEEPLLMDVHARDVAGGRIDGVLVEERGTQSLDRSLKSWRLTDVLLGDWNLRVVRLHRSKCKCCLFELVLEYQD